VGLAFVASRNGEMMSRGKNRKVPLVFGISLLLSIVLFLFDWYKPTDIAVWLFYLIPLLFTAYVAPRRTTYLLLLICTLLIGLGHVASKPLNPNVAVLNRLIGVTVLWLAIVILLERKRAEDNLRESKEQYQDLVELSPETIYIQQEGKFVFINSAGVKLFGASTPNDLLGKPVLDFLHPDSRESAAERIRMEKETGKEIFSFEEKYLRLDGTPVEMEISAVPIEYLGKAALQIFARDVTGRKQLEEQLRQSQKIEAVGRLAGGIAHDFNNLMTVITGYVGLTKKRRTNPEHVSKGLDEIGKAGLRATRLTKQLIAFSRKQILQPQILDLNRIVSNMDKMLRRLIGEDVELVTILGGNIGKVKADPGQIEQVVVNLALNARDAMAKGGRLQIETAEEILDESAVTRHGNLPAGPYVKLIFRDDGTGMYEETISHIFEPYFTTKEVGKGTGLGLATVYGIIRQSGGDIQVESEPGQGSTFTIWLPRVADAEATAEGVEPPLEFPRGVETILLVEDEEPVRAIVRETLEDAGYTVLDAPNGEEALTLLSRFGKPVHLILSDVVMPRMGGTSLAEQVASLYPGVKVLLISGYSEAALDKRDDLAKAIPFLYKPFTPYDLTNKIRKVLDS
jgi:two-component system cell cycle sensor histidine kinase/response regulator CckA